MEALPKIFSHLSSQEFKTIVEIKEKVSAIQEMNPHIRMIYAAVAGSRVYRNHFRDSDYDVVYLYVRHPDHYAKGTYVPTPSNVHIRDDKDHRHMRLPKTIEIHGKPLHECLSPQAMYYSFASGLFLSDLIMWNHNNHYERMRDFYRRHFLSGLGQQLSYNSYLAHLTAMVQQDYQKPTRMIKSFLRDIFFLINCLWIDQRPQDLHPSNIFELLKGIQLPKDVKQVIVTLISRQKLVLSGLQTAVDPILYAFLKEYVDKNQGKLNEPALRSHYEDDFKDLFESLLQEAWPGVSLSPIGL